MLIDEHQTPGPDLRDVETELCRLPAVAAARIVADHLGRPVEIHVLANDGKHPKQVVRDIQSVALASFGLEIDRRIVSVVQLGSTGEASVTAISPAPATPRTRVLAVESRMSGRRSTVRISLGADDREATGVAEGLVTAAARPRLVAGATLDALRQLEPAADQLEIEAAEPVRVGGDEIVIVTLVAVDPPDEHRLSGSAIVRQHPDDATVRATLDATNRWLISRGRAV